MYCVIILTYVIRFHESTECLTGNDNMGIFKHAIYHDIVPIEGHHVISFRLSEAKNMPHNIIIFADL